MKKLILASMLTLCSSAVFAEVAVIINPANANADAIGYIDSAKVSDKVKVVGKY